MVPAHFLALGVGLKPLEIGQSLKNLCSYSWASGLKALHMLVCLLKIEI